MSRIGIGVYGFGDDCLQALIKMSPSLVLLCDPPQAFYDALRKALPRVKVIYRHYIQEAEQEQMLRNPLVSALKMSDFLMGKADEMPGLWGIQTLNEIAMDPVMIARYDRFQSKLADYWTGYIMPHGVDHGVVKPVLIAGNFGVGNPQVGAATGGNYMTDQLVTMRSGWSTAKALKQPIGLHLYSAPNEPVDGPSHDWFATRYNFISGDIDAYEKAIDPRAQYPQPLGSYFVATESGTNAAWRGQYSPEEYFRQLKWLQDKLDHDGVLGQCVFGLFGRAGDQARWGGFDLLDVGNPSDTRIIDLISEHNTTQPNYNQIR